MSWTSIAFLISYDWPYLLAALVIGLLVGWRSFSPAKT